MFSTLPRTNLKCCLVTSVLSSSNTLNLDWCKILSFGKELKNFSMFIVLLRIISECPMEVTYPDIADNLSCKVTSLCTGIQCCMGSNEITQTFYSSVSIDICALEMVVELERIKFSVSLQSYVWGKKMTYNPLLHKYSF